MKHQKDNTLNYILLAIIVFGSISVGVVMAQKATQPDIIKDTISIKDVRKSFGYCPDSSILDKYGVSYTLESCPLSRLYIDNWDKLDDNTKTTIYNELLANGWRVEKE